MTADGSESEQLAGVTDKPNNPHYPEWALRYSRPETVGVKGWDGFTLAWVNG